MELLTGVDGMERGWLKLLIESKKHDEKWKGRAGAVLQDSPSPPAPPPPPPPPPPSPAHTHTHTYTNKPSPTLPKCA